MSFAFNVGALSSAAGMTVLHFLWQGAVIGVLAAAALRGCKRDAAQARYCVALAALGACGLVFLVTFALQLGSPASAGVGRVLAPEAGAASPVTWGLLSRTEMVSALWCCGVVVLTVRLCLQLAAARRLSGGGAGVAAPPEHWVDAFERIKARLGVHKAVRLVQHASIDTPMVVGWFAPVVLVPAGAFMSLTPEQFYAVLAHELAHVRRGDHLVNAAQAVVEVALFFHPVVWWLSSTVRVEREHCCDDVAVGAAASPLVFAEALARLETLRQVFPQAAVAANGGSLMERIERVLKVERPSSARSLRWSGAAAIGAAAVVAVAALAQVSVQPGAGSETAPAAGSNQLLRLVVPTVYVPAVAADDDQEVSPDEEPLYYEIELSPFSTEDGQDADQTMKQGTVQLTARVQTMIALALTDGVKSGVVVLQDGLYPATNAATEKEAGVQVVELTAQATLVGKKATGAQQRLDGHTTEADDRAVEAERVELDKIEDQVAAGTITREEADDMIAELNKKAAERDALAKKEAAKRANRK